MVGGIVGNVDYLKCGELGVDCIVNNIDLLIVL